MLCSNATGQDLSCVSLQCGDVMAHVFMLLKPDKKMYSTLDFGLTILVVGFSSKRRDLL